ncbi:MAG: BREX system P-loop protein BrxC [Planctomycetes bacterium]|nr:BREX system P-loop protein BrxC [Planctomycetota bacterium]
MVNAPSAPQLKTIRDLLERDLSKPIEEIIKLDQVEEQSVYTEITEYVATDRIRSQYQTLLKAMADAISEPHEGSGVWISGFFGSGKSSFAKNLGYMLSNRAVLGHRSAELLKKQLGDKRLSELIDFLSARIPTEVIMFDVSVDRAVRKTTEKMAEILYTVLLRELDYAEDYDVAELEIELEKEGKLRKFMELSIREYGEWREVRRGAQKMSRASTLLHKLDPATYPSPDSWAKSLHRGADITVAKLAQRTFELAALRQPGKAIAFIIDEVGQYVSRSADKILDLQAIVREFGKEGKNRLKKKETPAPVWIIVTAQEKLEEVVAAIGSYRVELAKLHDSFKYHIDLAPADISEVATRRVLTKKTAARPVLQEIFSRHQGQLNASLRLERSSRRAEVSAEDFIQFYPYPPHFIELSIDIMSGIRLQPGATKHLGGSNRTIIKQAYEMLVSERTAMGEKTVGALVSLDQIYELVEGNLPSERQKDISDVMQSFKNDPADGGMAARVAKAICLLEYVHDLPRTESNLAACLVEEVEKPVSKPAVERAIERLRVAQFIRQSENGWKLQSAKEKQWDTERNGFRGPRPRERNEISREILGSIFSESSLKIYRYKDLKNFRVGITVDGAPVGDEGQVPLALVVAEDEAEEFKKRREEIRTDSNQESNRDQGFWVFPLNTELDRLIEEVHASRKMISKYEELRAKEQLSHEDSACLQNEKVEEDRSKKRLREKCTEALQSGQGFFRGVAKDGSGLGKTLEEIFKNFFDYLVPQLYPKLELGARHLDGNEAEEVLKAANLNGLPQVLYAGEKGLNLIVQQGNKLVPNPQAEIAREILEYLRREHSYGNKVTGKILEQQFRGLGYGWDLDILRLVLAVLLRAGSIEVTHQGRRFRNHQDPLCRPPFTSNVSFRAASFAPRESVDLKTLTSAVKQLEELIGEEVDVEEGAIAAAFKKLALEEEKLLLPLEAAARANRLPFLGMLEDYRESIDGVLGGASDDCVRILAGEGKTFKASRDGVRRIKEILEGGGLEKILDARLVLERIWPVLASHGEGRTLEPKARELGALLQAEKLQAEVENAGGLAQEIRAAYSGLYQKAHEERKGAYEKATERIRGLPEFGAFPKETAEEVLKPLVHRACGEVTWDGTSTQCRRCNSTLSEMESDRAALCELERIVRQRIFDLVTPPEVKEKRTERVRIAEFFRGAIASPEELEEGLKKLREHLDKLLAEGARILLE